MSVSWFAKEISPKFPIGGLVDCCVQEVSLLIGDFGCELYGRMYTVEECYETIKGCWAILSQHKNVINVPFPTEWLLEVWVNESLFEEIHKINCIIGGSFGAHSSSPYLQIVFIIEGEVIASEDQSQ